MNWVASLRLVAAEDLLSVTGLVLLLVAGWAGDKAARAVTYAAVLALAVAAALVWPALTSGAAGADAAAFFGQVSVDAFAAYGKVLVYGAAAASLLVAPAFFERYGGYRAEYAILALFAALGMGLMVSATDLLTLYIGLEMNSLAAYVLAAMLRVDNRSAEAGLKYFVLGALASGILLFGMSLTYGFNGTTSFAGIAHALAAHHGTLPLGATFGIVFMMAGLAFKISAVPFHMWTPDVYEGAPTPVTTFFATAPKVAALALTMRVTLQAFGSQPHAWQQIVMFASLASIIVGALGAIGQGNIKRLLAYSSINNVGFMLVGLASGTIAGASAMLVYLAIYVMTSIAGFAVVLSMRDAEGKPVEAIADMAGLSRTNWKLSLAMAMVMFSLAGIPPLFGFWGKFVVFQAAVQAGYLPFAAFGIAASVIGAFYYLKVIKVMFFDEPANKVVTGFDGVNGTLALLACLFISPLGYLLSGWLGGLANLAVAALHAAG
ncbi:MAG TPA: NADH-quinone oxidoreductase subunit NuoN [Novosphingobium sp.]|nr:NADH-quinone oxidoreductase subunit NuoN [Novosphingobium sp.]